MASAVALAASACNRRPCSANASWVANALRTSRSWAPSSFPDHARIEPSAKPNDSSAASGSAGGSGPAAASIFQPSPSGLKMATPSSWKLVASSCANFGSGSGSCNTVPAIEANAPRLGPSAYGVVAAARRQVDERADDACDHEEAHERKEVTRVGDRERVDRWCEVPVQQQERTDRRDGCRDRAADGGDQHDEQEVHE